MQLFEKIIQGIPIIVS